MDRICEVLDPQVIRQQAEQGVLDFKSYANFIIQLMAKSCAPVRDDEVAKLNEIEDVVLTFRGILEVMDLMKLDMANCLLDAARREVITHSVEYEKQKFNEYLKLYTSKWCILTWGSFFSGKFHFVIHFSNCRWFSGYRKLVES